MPPDALPPTTTQAAPSKPCLPPPPGAAAGAAGAPGWRHPAPRGSLAAGVQRPMRRRRPRGCRGPRRRALRARHRRPGRAGHGRRPPGPRDGGRQAAAAHSLPLRGGPVAAAHLASWRRRGALEGAHGGEHQGPIRTARGRHVGARRLRDPTPHLHRGHCGWGGGGQRRGHGALAEPRGAPRAAGRGHRGRGVARDEGAVRQLELGHGCPCALLLRRHLP
mmetsp:Transcript_111263/g.359177  ORF Transcript_111263/g.359177 Transcript_111263/m.359177 type:complete len:220 (+) Transcript_111263:264-923(+)